MSQFHNDLCINSIEELRKAFRGIHPTHQPNTQTQPNQTTSQKDVERVVETTQTQPTTHCHSHCHPMIYSMPACNHMPYQSYVIVQEEPITEKKKSKKRMQSQRNERIEIQQPIQQLKSSKKRLESPNINLQSEIDQLEQLIRQVRIQQQPSQVLEYNIDVPAPEKKKDNTEMIAMLSALKPEPIQLPKDDFFKIENARLHEEIKNTKINLHELQVKYDELLKRKRKEKIVKEIEYKEIPKIVEVPRDVVREVIKPIEVIKEVIKEVEKPSQINMKEIPIYIPQYKEVIVNKEVPVYKEVPVEKEVKVYKDIPVYKDVPVYHDVPVYRDVPIYQKIPIYREVPVYNDPINVYREVPVIKEVQRIPETIIEFPRRTSEKRIVSPYSQTRSYIRSPNNRREF